MFKRKLLMVSALYSAFQLVSNTALAGDLPSGGVVKSGDIDISRATDSLQILQKTDKGIIEWQDFSVGRDKSVHFQQPSKTSATLNRVTGDFTSKIAGQITATGQVFLVNPNGILITKDGAINTQGFIASTLDITDYNFNKSNYIFSQKGKTGLVENQGTIDVADGGVVALLGGAVKNTGTVNAHLGKIGFAGGERIVMSFGDNDFLRVEVPTKDLSTIKDANGNPISDVLDVGGTVKADGGMVQLTVATAAKILRQRISMGGRVQVNTAVRKNGIIRISGDDVQLNKDAKIIADNGQVKIDSNTLTSKAVVRASGGNIDVNVAGDTTLNTGASFDVSGDKAGKIAFTAGTRKVSRFKSEADFKADSTKGTGGYIDITANKGLVWLVSGNISAKGTTQGGRIRIGGAFQGGSYNAKTTNLDKKATDSFVNRWGDNSTLQSADDLKVESAVTINTTASAGSGGTVILWSEKATDNAGKIDARGVGQQGGSVEISGKKDLINIGLKQVHVNGGTLLLDPKNITVNNSGTDALTGANPQLSKIKTQLEAGTAVTLKASNDITISVAINTLGGAQAGKLTLIAGRSIILNADVEVKGGLELIANASSFSTGMVAAERDDGVAKIKISGWASSLNGDLIVKMQDGLDGATDAKRYSGTIEIDKARGKRVSIVHNGKKFDTSDGDSKNKVIINSGGFITSTADKLAGAVGIEIKATTFHNGGSPGALSVASGGRYLVWTETPTNNTYGRITNYTFSEFNKSYNTGGGDFQTHRTGSGFIYSANPSAFNAGGASKTKVYNNNITADTSSLTIALKNPDGNGVATVDGIKFKVGSLSGNSNKYIDVKVTKTLGSATGKYYNTAGTAEQKNAGNSLKIKYSSFATYADGNNKPIYGFTADVTGASITKRTLTATADPVNRQYTGDNGVALTNHSIGGWATGDTYTYDKATAGSTMLAVSVRTTVGTHSVLLMLAQLTPALKTNYTLVHATNKTVTISKRKLTLKAADFNAITKTYDGNKTATVSLTSTGNQKGLSGIPTDASASKLSLTIQAGAFEYDSKDVDVNGNIKIKIKDINKLKLGGRDVAQFELGLGKGDDSGLTGAITHKILTLDKDDFQPITKVYDGGTSVKGATIKLKTQGSPTGFNETLHGSDAPKLAVDDDALVYASKDVAGGNIKLKVVKYTGLKLTGTGAANYKLDSTTYANNNDFGSFTATITARELTLKGSNFTATKTYDGNKDAGTSVVTLTSGTGLKTAAEEARAGNNDKGVVGNESVTFTIRNGMFAFDKKDARGTNAATKLVVLSNTELNKGITNTNYKFNYTGANKDTDITATINKRELTLKMADFKAVTKAYDGTTVAAKTTVVALTNGAGNNRGVKTAAEEGSPGVSSTTKGVVGRDKVTFTIASDMFKFDKAQASSNSGASTLLVVDKDKLNAGLDATSKNNYQFKYRANHDTGKSATITKRVLTLNAADFKSVTKTYDGDADITTAIVKLNTNASGLTGVQNNESLKLIIAADMFKFNSKDVASADKLLVTTAAKLNDGLDGATKANYKFNYGNNAPSGISATITKKTLTVTVNTDATRVYDGTKVVSVQGKTKTVTGWIGNDGKVGEQAGGQLKTVAQVFAGNLDATIPDKDVGRKKINFTNLALKSNNVNKNYSFKFADKYITITQKEITVTATPTDREYDGTKKIALNNKTFNTSHLLQADWATAQGAGAGNVNTAKLSDITTGDFEATVADGNADENTRKTVTFAGKVGSLLTLKSAYATNYKIKYDDTQKVTISKRTMSLNKDDFTVTTRVYNGAADTRVTVALKITGSETGLIDSKIVGSEDVKVKLDSATDTFEYADGDAGVNKKLQLKDHTKLKLDGRDKANYKFATSWYKDDGVTVVLGTISKKKLTLNMNDLEVVTRGYSAGDTSVTVRVKNSATGLNNADIIAADTGKVKLNIGAGAFQYATAGQGDTKTVNWKDKSQLTLVAGASGNRASNYELDLSAHTTVYTSLKGKVRGVALTITLRVQDRDYNGNDTITVLGGGKGTIGAGAWLDNSLPKDWDSVFGTNNIATAKAKSKNAGTWDVTFSGLTLKKDYTDKGYVIKYAPVQVTIRQKVLTLKAGDFNAVTKVYDGKEAIKGSAITLKSNAANTGIQGVVNNETVTLTFNDKMFKFDKKGAAGTSNAGTKLLVASNDELTKGLSSKNYKFNYDDDDEITGITASISKRELTLNVADFKAVEKTYDGDADITTTIVKLKTGNNITGLTNVANNEDLKLNINTNMFKFNSKNVDADKLLVVSSANLFTGLQGTTKANYEFKYGDNSNSGIAAKIKRRELTVTADLTTRVYDGTASITGITNRRIKSGFVTNDKATDGTTPLTLTYAGAIASGSFTAAADNKNVGRNKAVTFTNANLTLKPAYSNYKLSFATDAKVEITQRNLTVTADLTTRVYDGTASITGITNRRIKSGFVTNDKATDGTTPLTLTYAGAIASGSFTAAANNKNVGRNKAVTFTNANLTLKPAYSNYKLIFATDAKVEITQRNLTVTADLTTRVYDGTASITGITNRRIKSGFVTNDKATDGTTPLTLTYAGAIASGSFTAAADNKNVGRNKAVTFTNANLTLKPAYSNYKLIFATDAKVEITQRNLTVTADLTTRVYDGTASITGITNRRIKSGFVTNDKATDGTTPLTLTYAGAIASGSFTAAADNKNVGRNKAVTFTNANLTLKPAYSNYKLSFATDAKVEITQRNLTVTADLTTRVYDGTASITGITNRRIKSGFVTNDKATDGTTPLTLTYAGAIASGSFTAAADNKNVGRNKAVTFTNANLTLKPAYSNYKLSFATDAKVEITQRVLTVTATATNRSYNGLTNVTVTGHTFKAADATSGFVTNDKTTDGTTNLTLTYAGAIASGTVTASVANKTAANGKAVKLAGNLALKAAYSNYKIEYATGVTVNITKKKLTLIGTDFRVTAKTYDGDTDATVSVVAGDGKGLSGVQNNERVTVTVQNDAFKFATKNVTDGGTQIQVADVNKLVLSDTTNYEWDSAVVRNNANVANLKGTINKKQLTLKIGDLKVEDKLKSGNDKSATVTVKTPGTGFNQNLIRNDDVKLKIDSGAFEFEDANLGANKKIKWLSKAKVTLDGNDKGNYNLDLNSFTNGAIVPNLTGRIMNLYYLVVNADVQDRTYNGGIGLTIQGTPSITGGWQAGDGLTHTWAAAFKTGKKTVTAVAASKNAGQQNVDFNPSISGRGATLVLNDAYYNKGYRIRFAAKTVQIAKKVLTLKASDFDAVTKTYDGGKTVAGASVTLKTDASQTGITDGQVESGDNIKVDVKDGALEYASENVHGSITLNVIDNDKLELTGTGKDNYKFNYSANADSGLKGAITPKTLTVSATVVTRAYNKSKVVAVSNPTITGWVSGETKTWAESVQTGNLTAAVADENASGTAKAVTFTLPTMNTTGHFANYTFAPDTGKTIIITKRELVLNKDDFQTVTKTYDGDATATTTEVKLKTNGEDGLKTAGKAGGDKGVITGDTVTFTIANGMFKFNSKDVASADKLLITTKANLNRGLGGNDASNYEFKYANDAPSTILATITEKELTLEYSELEVTTRQYGSAYAPVVVKQPGVNKKGLRGVLGNDQVTLRIGSQGFTYADKTVGTQRIKVWDKRQVTFHGGDAGNYKHTAQFRQHAWAGPSTFTGTITERVLTIKTDDFTITKQYDGDNKVKAVNVTLKQGATGLNNVFTADNSPLTLNIKDGALEYASTGVNGSIQLNVADYSLLELKDTNNGAYAKNYVLNKTRYANTKNSGLTGAITQKVLTLKASDFVVTAKTYNGDNTATVSLTTAGAANQKGLTGVVGNEQVTLTLGSNPFVYEDVDAGQNKKLLVTNKNKLILGGTHKDNYIFTYAPNAESGITATVAQKALTLKMDELEVETRAFKAGDKSATVKVKTGSTPAPTGLNAGVLNADKGKVKLNIGADAFQFVTAGQGADKQVNWKQKSLVTLTGDKAKNYKLNLDAYTDNTDSTLKGTISGMALTITVSVNDRDYDGTNKLTVGNGGKGTIGAGGWLPTESLSKDWDNVFKSGKKTVTATVASKNVGTYDVIFNGLELKQDYITAGYTITYAPKRVTISKKVLTLKAADFQAVTKTYDGGKTVAGATVKLKTDAGRTGITNGEVYTNKGDNVKVTVKDGALEYASKDANGSIQLNVIDNDKLELTGTGAGNYKFNYSPNAASGIDGAITKKTLTVSATVASTRVYNNSKSVAVSNPTITGWVSNAEEKSWADSVSTGSLTAAVANENASTTAKPVTFTLPTFNTGGVFDNYTFVADTSKKITITKRQLVLKASEFQAVRKTYDGNTNATVTVVKLNNNVDGLQSAAEAGAGKGVAGGDTVTFTIANDMFKFNSKNVTADKLMVTTKDALNAGLDTGSKVNYEFTYSPGADSTIPATITEENLVVTVNTDARRVYDGTTTVDVSGKTITIAGWVGNEGKKGAGGTTDKTLADISTAASQLTATVGNKDASTTAKTITFGGVTLKTSTLYNNYNITYTAKSIFIDKATLTVTSAVQDRKYNRGRALTLTGNITVSGWVKNSEAETNLANIFADPTALRAVIADTESVDADTKRKAVTLSGLAFKTANRGVYKNYTLVHDTGQKVTISKKDIVVDVTVTNRPYDGGTTIAYTATSPSGVERGDWTGASHPTLDELASGTLSASVATKTAKDGKTVSFTGKNLRGGYTTNYNLTFANKTVNITPKVLTLKSDDFVATEKVYNGLKNVTVNIIRNRTGLKTSEIVGRDNVTLTVQAGAFEYHTKDAADSKRINVADNRKLVLGGTDGANYKFNYTANADSGITGKVTQKTLTVTATVATTREYNGDVNVGVSNPSFVAGGFIVGDKKTDGTTNLTLTYAAAINNSSTLVGEVGDKDVGANKTVTLKGLSLNSDYSNYKLAYVTNKKTEITPATVHIKISDLEVEAKKYDGTKAAKVIVSASKKGIQAPTTASNAVKTKLNTAISNDNVTLVIDNGDYDRQTGTRSNNGAFEFNSPIKGQTQRVDYKDVSKLSLGGTGKGNYNFVISNTLNGKDSTLKGLVGTRILWVTGTVQNRTYDGGTSLTILTTAVSGQSAADAGKRLLSDFVTDVNDLKANAASKDHGTRSVVFTGLTLKPSFGGSYVLQYKTDVTVTISQKTLTLKASDFRTVTKVYDGKKTVTVALKTAADMNQKGLTGVVGSEKVTLNLQAGAFEYATTDVSGSIQLKVKVAGNIKLAGDDKDNYKFAFTNNNSGLTGAITKRVLTVTSAVQNRAYTGNRDLTLTGNTTVSGWADGEEETTLANIFTNPSALTAKIATSENVNASTTAKAVTLSGLAFKTPNSALYKNYSLAYDTSKTVTISKKEITVTATVAEREYDGTKKNFTLSSKVFNTSDLLQADWAAAGGSGNVNTARLSDITTGDFEATVPSKDADENTAQRVTFVGKAGNLLTLKTAYRTNYKIKYDTTKTVKINKRTVTVTADVTDRAYDGTKTNFSFTNVSQSGYINAEYGGGVTPKVSDLTTGTLSATVPSQNANETTAQRVTFNSNSLTLKTAYRTNYKIAYATNKTVKILKKALVVTADLTSRVYDGTTSITGITNRRIKSGFVANDKGTDGTTDLTLTYAAAIASGSFTAAADNKNVGGSKAVTFTNAALTLKAAYSNYKLTYATDAKVTINQRALKVTATATNRPYNRGTNVTVTGHTFKAADATSGFVANDKTTDGANNLTLTYAAAIASGAVTASVADKTAADGKAVTLAGNLALNAAYSNYKIEYATDVTVNITKKTLTLKSSDFRSVSKVYNGDDDATVALVTAGDANKKGLTGVINGDTVTLAVANNAFEFADENVADGIRLNVVNKNRLTLGGADRDNYEFTYAPNSDSGLTGNITQRTLTLNKDNFTITKVYDGNTGITNSHITLAQNTTGLSNVVNNDNVTLTIGANAFEFADKNAGTNDRQVNIKTASALTLGGTARANYKLNYDDGDDSTIRGTISKKTLTVTVNTDATQTYNGGTAVNLTNKTITITGWIGHEGKQGERDGGVAKTLANITTTASNLTATVGNKNASTTAKRITFGGVTLKNTGVYVNYELNFAAKTITITKKVLTLKSDDFVATEKVYNGRKNVTVNISRGRTGLKTSEIVGRDNVTLRVDAGAFEYHTKDAADNKRINVADNRKLVLGGTDGGNYKFNYTANADSGIKGKVTKKTLTVTADVATTREYNGDVNVGVSNPSFVAGGFIVGDKKTDGTTNLTLTYAAAINNSSTLVGEVANKNVGAGKAVTLKGLSLNSDYSNYKLAYVTNKTTTITAATVNIKISDLEVRTKEYDGTKAAKVIVSASKKGIQAASANNAVKTKLNTAIGNDNVHLVINNGDYDTATGTRSNNGAFEFNSPIKGTSQQVDYKDVSKLSLGGTGKDNYNLVISNTLNGTDSTLKGVITTKILWVTGTVQNRTYDGGTSLTILTTAVSGQSAADAGKGLSDFVTNVNDLKANAASKDHGTRSVIFTGLTLKPSFGGSYVLQYRDTVTVNITKRTLTVTATVASRAYDGTTTTTLSNPTISGWATRDNDSIKTYAGAKASGTLVGTAASKNVGTPRVTFSGVTFKTTAGTYGNYNFVYDTTKTVRITKKDLTVTATVATRAYDGTTTTTLSNPTISGWATRDNDSIKTYAGARASGTLVGTAASKNAGTQRVTFRGVTFNTTAGTYGNYNFVYDTTKTVTINKVNLTVTANVDSRAYDGTTGNLTLRGKTISGWVARDDDSIKTYAGAKASGTLVATAASKNVGTPGVTFSGVTFNTTVGTYGNYNFVYATDKTVSITKKNLTVTATVASRPYDGTTTTTLSNPTISGWAAADNARIKTYAGARASGTLVGTATSKNVGTQRVTFRGVTFNTTAGTYGNYNFVYDTTKTVNISKKNLTVTANVTDRTYNGTTGLALSGESISGWIASDGLSDAEKALSAATSGTLLGTANSKNVGTPGVTFSGLTMRTTGKYANYEITYATDKTVTISQKTITLNMRDLTVATKSYDGTTDATVNVASGNQKGLNDISGNDRVTLATAGAFKFADKNAGTHNIQYADVNNLVLNGADAGNYKLSTYTNNDNSGLTGTIIKKKLTLNTEDYTVTDKVYDDSTAVKVTVGDWKPWGLTGVVGDEDVKVGITDGAFEFATKDPDANKQINIADRTKLRLMGSNSVVANYEWDDSVADNADSGLRGTIRQVVSSEAINIFKNVMKTNPLTGSAVFSARQRVFVPTPAPVVIPTPSAPAATPTPSAPAPAPAPTPSDGASAPSTQAAAPSDDATAPSDGSVGTAESPAGQSVSGQQQKAESQDADKTAEEKTNEQSQDNSKVASADDGAKETTEKKRGSGNFVVSLKGLEQDGNEQYAKAFNTMIANPDRKEDENDEGIILIFDE